MAPAVLGHANRPVCGQVEEQGTRRLHLFLINFLPDARRRLKLEVEDIRKANPRIIYVRGSGHGQRGPEAEKGGYDQPSFWCRSGAAWSATPADSPRPIGMPAGAYGDSIGGMTIAGGIAGALFGRERTGEPAVVDVSLLGVGIWAMALNVTNSMLTGETFSPLPLDSPAMNVAVNPIVGNFRTADGRWINFNMLQPGRYFADVCKHLGLEYLLEDERFTTADGLMANAARRRPASQGQQLPRQHHRRRRERTSAGGEPRTVRRAAPPTKRAPQFAEHTDAILRAIGRSEEEILQLKIDGACT